MATTGGDPMTGMKGTVTTPPGPSTSPPQYEFPESENALFRNLAWKMHFVGLFLISIGLLTIAIGGLVLHIGPILTGTYSAILGIWTQRASTAFKSIVDTQGKDVTHLLEALEDLRKLYTLQYWLCVLTLAVALFALGWVCLKGPGYL
jgi:hypothetical protein